MLLLELCIVALLLKTDNAVKTTTPPNIVFILADDLGYGEVGCFGQEKIKTPHIDALAKEGVRLTEHYSGSPVCASSRCVLLTGLHTGHAEIRNNREVGGWGPDEPEGQLALSEGANTIGSSLQKNGYATGAFGKWGLGGPESVGQPNKQGFDTFYGYLCQRVAHNYYPTHLWNNETKEILQGNESWFAAHEKLDAPPATYDRFAAKTYAPDLILEEAVDFIDAHAKEPFFLYFASPANHGPYTPSKTISGIPVAGASRYKNGTPAENNRQDFVYQNDVHVSRLLRYLKTTSDPRRPKHSLIDNTLFVFTSDNGAEKDNKQFTGPLRSNKGSTYEGGHRVPFIASWPAGGVGDGDDTTLGKTQSTLLGLNDLYATVAEVLEKNLPPVTGVGRGAEDSISQLSALKGDATFRRSVPLFPNDHQEASKKLSDERAWVAVRSNTTPLVGQWKLFLDHRYAFKQEIHPQELYNLAMDPLEQENLLQDPQAKPALDYLIAQAIRAAGDDGFTRTVKSD